MQENGLVVDKATRAVLDQLESTRDVMCNMLLKQKEEQVLYSACTLTMTRRTVCGMPSTGVAGRCVLPADFPASPSFPVAHTCR